MLSFSFNLKDLLRSVVLGVLLGWLLVTLQAPAHERFDFIVTDSTQTLASPLV